MRRSVLALNLVVLALSCSLCLIGCQPAAQSEDISVQPAVSVETVAGEQPELKPIPRTKPVVSEEKPDMPVKELPFGHIEVNKIEHNFGDVEPGAKVVGEFTVTNVGKGPWKLKKLGKSCGCTEPEIGKKTLQPGESTPLSVTYTAGQRPGKTSKKLWIESRSPSQPSKLTMSIVCNIRKHINNTPEKYEFQLRDSEKNSVPLIIESVDGTEFSIIDCAATAQAVSVEFDKNLKSARHELPITVDLDKLRTHQRGTISVKTNHPKTKTITVTFSVLMPFSVKPRTLFFKNMSPGEQKRGKIVVVSNYGDSFELGPITSKGGLVEVLGVEDRQDGYGIDVALSWPTDADDKRIIKDSLMIEIKNRPDDSIRVLCSGRPPYSGKPRNVRKPKPKVVPLTGDNAP